MNVRFNPTTWLALFGSDTFIGGPVGNPAGNIVTITDSVMNADVSMK